jgi:hypothetical protein
VTGSETYRPWNWADRILGEHGDSMATMDEWFAARQESEGSRWWWMCLRFDGEMAKIIAEAEAGTAQP